MSKDTGTGQPEQTRPTAGFERANGEIDESAPKAMAEQQLHDFLSTHRRAMCRFFQTCGLFSGHPALLFHLSREPGLTQRALAEKMAIAPPTVAVSVKRMEAAGLIRREPDPDDARAVRLYLTEEGLQMDAKCRHGRQFLIDTLFADFSDEELTLLMGFIGRMDDNLQKASQNL